MRTAAHAAHAARTFEVMYRTSPAGTPSDQRCTPTTTTNTDPTNTNITISGPLNRYPPVERPAAQPTVDYINTQIIEGFASAAGREELAVAGGGPARAPEGRHR